MFGIIKIAVTLSTLLVLGFAQPKGPNTADDNLCSKTLTADQIKQWEACEQYVPQSIKNNNNACLTKLNMGTTITDLRTVICDSTLAQKFGSCIHDLIKSQKRSGPPSKADQDAMKKQKECMKKVR